MAKPKLALIPSGVADDKVFSVLPSNGDGDFDFTRGSTATRVNAQGLIETVSNDLPRLNYPLLDGVVQECPSLLLEPSRTNLVPYSEDFSQWTASDLTVTDNNAISPDGTLNASKLTAISGVAGKRIQETGFPTTSTERCYSIFVKTDDIKAIQLLHSGDLQGFARFDLVNYRVGSVGSKTTATIENYGNGWYKCTAIFNSTNAFGSSLYMYFSDSAIGSYGGTSSQVGDLFTYGIQYEQGSYPTSYIPTNGSAVTRLAETCNGAGTSDTFSDSSGVLMAEISALANDGTDRVLSLSDGSANNRIVLYYNSSNNLVAQVYSISNNLQGTITVSDLNITENSKVSVKYETSSIKLYLNGFLKGTQSIAVSAINLSELDFDNGVGGADFYGKTKQIQYFDTALTDSELETLTSWVSFQEMAEGQLYTIE